MGFGINNLFNNNNLVITKQIGNFSVGEWQQDVSVTPGCAQTAYFSSLMNVRKRQLICDTSEGIICQAGAMQWMIGNVDCRTDIKGAADLGKKMLRGKVTGESAVKPLYKGNGMMVLEPTYKHILLLDVAKWNGGIVMDDRLFFACSSSLEQKAVSKNSFSAAAAGGQGGLFNLALFGQGVAALESPVPQEELMEITLDNDVLKVDGPYALVWSPSLQYSVERSSRSLLGSAVNGEGLVNVFRGNGKVLMAPIRKEY